MQAYWHIVQAIRHNSPNYGLIYAAKYGYEKLAELMLKKGAADYNCAMHHAAENGYRDIVVLMLEKGASDYNWAMLNAAMGGHRDIVVLMLEKGATNYDLVIEIALEQDRMDIADLIQYWKTSHS
jgi:ankyrin repeat protein